MISIGEGPESVDADLRGLAVMFVVMYARCEKAE